MSLFVTTSSSPLFSSRCAGGSAAKLPTRATFFLKTSVCSLFLLLGACAAEGESTEHTRGGLDKADLIGSCSPNSCGDQAENGSCWCDSQCEGFGDCCSNASIVCELDACSACLADGGTWQPEAEACTADCDIQDISCFVDRCPDVPTEDCDSCLASGGTWQPEAESCTADCDIQDISCFVDSCPAVPSM